MILWNFSILEWMLDEVSSCGNLSDSDVSNESGRGNKSMIDPSLPGLLAVRRVRKLSLVREMKAKVKRIAHMVKHLSMPKLHKSLQTQNGEVLQIFCHTP